MVSHRSAFKDFPSEIWMSLLSFPFYLQLTLSPELTFEFFAWVTKPT